MPDLHRMSMPASTDPAYVFGPFTLQPDRRRLLDGSHAVALGARAFDLLVALVEGRERTMTKDELLHRVWPDCAVEQNNLTVNISSLRKGLRDRPTDQRYIRTIPGRGYRFVAAVEDAQQRVAWAPTAEAVPQKPSIAVLPFVTMSPDIGQTYFGEGIAEDILSELARNRWLTVIARNASFTFRDQVQDLRDVAAKLGVRYVLGGSVRSAGTQVRVTAYLMDAATNTQLVTERFDREMADIFGLQDEITSLITQSVRPALIEAEQERSLRRHPDSVDAWTAYQCGVWHFSRFQEPASAEAQQWFQKAIDLDPRFAPGHYGLALVHLHDGSGYIPSTQPDWQARGEQLAMKAVALDPRDSDAHSVLAVARMVRGDHEGALAAVAQALALNPGDAGAHGTAGAALVFSGRPLEGLQALATCLRLNPRDPRLHVRYAHIGLGHYFADQYAKSEATALDIIDRWPGYALGPRLLAMVQAETGRLAEARASIDAAIALSPAPFDDFSHARMPWYGAAAFRKTLAAMQRTGWTGTAH